MAESLLLKMYLPAKPQYEPLAILGHFLATYQKPLKKLSVFELQCYSSYQFVGCGKSVAEDIVVVGRILADVHKQDIVLGDAVVVGHEWVVHTLVRFDHKVMVDLNCTLQKLDQ